MRRALGAVMLLLAAVTPAAAQGPSDAADWPTRPLGLIVASTPGSAADTVCRIVAQKLTERLGQPFVFDNRPAAGGTVAVDGLAHSRPDGYTLGLITTSTQVIATLFTAGLP